jgi:putative transposase
MEGKSYPTDLTDMEWEILVPLIPPAKEGGHPPTTDMGEICNAIYESFENWMSMEYASR